MINPNVGEGRQASAPPTIAFAPGRSEDGMPVLTRFWVLGIGVSIIVAAVAAGVWLFTLRIPPPRSTCAMPSANTERTKRRELAGSAHLPPSGVYRYLTSGSERLSSGGISGSFPAPQT